MRNFILFCFLIIITNGTQAQVTLQVSDSETQQNIEFASILLPDYQKSFVADENGVFKIDTNKYKLPLKIIIKQFGFERNEITLQTGTTNHNIFLNPSSELLREMIIPPANAKIKERTFGRTNDKKFGEMQGEDHSFYNFNKIELGYEFGMIINTNNKFKKIKKVHWHIDSISLEKAVYGLQFYEVENGKPSKRIPYPNINFTLTNKNTGWNIINVEDFDIYIDGHKKIAVTLKMQKAEFEKDKKVGSVLYNVSFASRNFIVEKFHKYDSQYEEWMAFPVNFPFYITVDSYE